MDINTVTDVFKLEEIERQKHREKLEQMPTWDLAHELLELANYENHHKRFMEDRLYHGDLQPTVDDILILRGLSVWLGNSGRSAYPTSPSYTINSREDLINVITSRCYAVSLPR